MELARPKKKEPSPKKEEKKAPVAAKPVARPVGGHGQCTPGIYDARLKHLKDGQDDDEIDQIKKEIKEAAKKEEKKNSTTAAPTTSSTAAPADPRSARTENQGFLLGDGGEVVEGEAEKEALLKMNDSRSNFLYFFLIVQY